VNTPTLTFNRPIPGVVMITVEDPPSNTNPIGTAWHEMIQQTVYEGFMGRNLWVVQPDPPLEWGDLDLAELSPTITKIAIAGNVFRLVFLPHASDDLIAHVSRSEDFVHGALQIATLSGPLESDYRPFVTALQQAKAHYPAWDTYLRTSPSELEALFQTEMRIKVKSNVEFVETDRDGDILYWYNPQPEALARATTTLQASATTQGWHVLKHQ
jgi:hypothetical protein